MTANLFIKLLHILAAIWMIAGIIGRQLTRSQALKTDQLPIFLAFTHLAGRFESLMVRPGSLAIVLSGVIVALIQGWPIFGFLQGSPINWLLASNVLILAMALVIALIFVPRGRVFERLLAEAQSQGKITTELRASFEDPIVRWGHRFEELATLVIIYLMVMKPF
jgi:hypothetical protein